MLCTFKWHWFLNCPQDVTDGIVSPAPSEQSSVSCPPVSRRKMEWWVTRQQTSGVGDKRFFRFKRNAYHLWTAIIRHCLNDIIHQQVMRFNQRSKFAIIFKVHLKQPQCFRTLVQPSYFLSNTPIMIGSSLDPHLLNGYGSMTSVPINTIYGTGDPALVDMWRTSHQNMKYQSSLRRRVITGGSQNDVRVSRRMDCRIGLIKFHVSANN